MLIDSPYSFYCPPQKTYSVHLETSLSTHFYHISGTSRTEFVADEGKHITLNFTAEVRDGCGRIGCMWVCVGVCEGGKGGRTDNIFTSYMGQTLFLEEHCKYSNYNYLLSLW